jgi:uncharacterized protein YbjT (DUF2867 family)
VIGGTGRLGRLVTARLLERGERVRAIGRHRWRAGRGPLPAGAEFVPGDVRDAASISRALDGGPGRPGCSGIVYCVEPGTDDSGPDRPEATLHTGVRNVLAAAAAGRGRPHLVLVSQLHATHQGHPLNAYGRLLEWRLAGEDAVRSGPLPYTVVRPGWLTDDPPGPRRVRLEQGDHGSGTVSRHTLADACVRALTSPYAEETTFEIFDAGDAAAVPGWDGMFAALEPDRALVP